MKNRTRKILVIMTLVMTVCMMGAMNVTAGTATNSAPSPVAAATLYRSTNVTLSITVTTSNGTTIDQVFRTNASGAWATIGVNSGVGNSTLTDSCALFTTYGKKYFWSSNSTLTGTGATPYSNNTYNMTIRFTDKPDDTGGGSTPGSYIVGVYIKDPNGNPLSDALILINSVTRVTNLGGYASFMLDDGTYSVRVTHDDCTFSQGSLVVNGADRTLTMVSSGTPSLSTTDDAGITDDVKIGVIAIAAAVLGYSMIFVKGYSPKKLLLLVIPAIAIIAMITL